MGEDLATWRPVLPRGNGAWIGILVSGRIGVGVAGEGRASLEGSGFVPMWPFMERGLSECLGEFRGRWDVLADGGIASPERLFELTVSSAVESRRPYWMQAAASWLVEMQATPGFDRALVHTLIRRLSASPEMSQQWRHRLRKALKGTEVEQESRSGNPRKPPS
ncbi:hypothetical protein [Embleya sp. MST-111070]|uniref:hypothetical protein n=1 Tax=Embleya sp. MST-111070 TaxID=3398231 RepID=UPI003F740713